MEYAKKTPFDKQINWASVSTEVADKALEIGQKRKDRKVALDQQMADYELQLSNQKAFKTESLTSKWMDMADKSRQIVFQANKDLKSRKISESEYKKIVGNMSEYTKTVADTANNFDADIQAYIARQTPNEKGIIEGGSYEMEMLNQFGKLADFKNKNFSVLPDGRIAIDSVDENGNVTSTLDLMSMNKAENRFAPKNDIDTATSNVVKDWKQWTEFEDLGRGAWSSVEDMRKNPYIGEALYKAVKSINNTPKSTLSTLIDYGVVKEPLYAYNENELKSVKEKAVADLVKMRQEMGVSTAVTAKDLAEIENRIIRVDPNTADPILTEAQKTLANKTVEELIQMKMSHEEEGGAKQDWSKPARTTTDGDGSGDKSNYTNLYEDLFTAWDLSRGGTMASKKESEGRFNALAKGEFEFEWVPGGMQVYKIGTDSRGKKTRIEVPGTINSLDALQKYFYPDKNRYDFEKQEYLGKKQKVSKKTESTKTKKKPEDLRKKYNY